VLRRIEPVPGASSTAEASAADELEKTTANGLLEIGAARSQAVVPVMPQAELETTLLPHDQPRWVKDAVAVSQRARDIVAKLRPVAMHVLSFWDHRIRIIVVAGRAVRVDASGCYRSDV
jgi:hypothetical protein